MPPWLLAARLAALLEGALDARGKGRDIFLFYKFFPEKFATCRQIFIPLLRAFNHAQDNMILYGNTYQRDMLPNGAALVVSVYGTKMLVK